MHECVMLALWDTFTTVILSTVMGKSTIRVMNMKDVFLKCKNKRLH